MAILAHAPGSTVKWRVPGGQKWLRIPLFLLLLLGHCPINTINTFWVENLIKFLKTVELAVGSKRGIVQCQQNKVSWTQLEEKSESHCFLAPLENASVNALSLTHCTAAHQPHKECLLSAGNCRELAVFSEPCFCHKFQQVMLSQFCNVRNRKILRSLGKSPHWT